MTPEQTSKLLEIISSISLVAVGAAGGVFSAWISANKNLEAVKLNHKHENKKLSTDIDLQLYREALLSLEALDAQLNAIGESVLNRILLKKHEPTRLSQLTNKLQELRKLNNPAVAKEVLKSTEEILTIREGIVAERVQATEDTAAAVKGFNLALSEISTSSYLTGNKAIIKNTAAFQKTAHEIYKIFMGKNVRHEDIAAIDHTANQSAKFKLKATISEEFRKLF